MFLLFRRGFLLRGGLILCGEREDRNARQKWLRPYGFNDAACLGLKGGSDIDWRRRYTAGIVHLLVE